MTDQPDRRGRKDYRDFLEPVIAHPEHPKEPARSPRPGVIRPLGVVQSTAEPTAPVALLELLAAAAPLARIPVPVFQNGILQHV